MATSLEKLRQEVEGPPRDVGPRLRLGEALMERGRRVEEAASELLLASRMDPGSPHIALVAIDALLRAERARDAALHLSAYVRTQTATTRIAPAEQWLLEHLLGHPDRFVRCHTARAIGHLKFAACLDVLERACQDPDGAVRLAAIGSLRILRAH